MRAKASGADGVVGSFGMRIETFSTESGTSANKKQEELKITRAVVSKQKPESHFDFRLRVCFGVSESIYK